jgi:prevent-host-death family protein
METVSIEAARGKLGDLIDQAMTGQPVTITRYRRPAAVLVPVAWYQQATECLDREGTSTQ